MNKIIDLEINSEKSIEIKMDKIIEINKNKETKKAKIYEKMTKEERWQGIEETMLKMAKIKEKEDILRRLRN